MSRSICRLYYHLVWTVKYRLPLMNLEIERGIKKLVEEKAK